MKRQFVIALAIAAVFVLQSCGSTDSNQTVTDQPVEIVDDSTFVKPSGDSSGIPPLEKDTTLNQIPVVAK